MPRNKKEKPPEPESGREPSIEDLLLGAFEEQNGGSLFRPKNSKQTGEEQRIVIDPEIQKLYDMC